MPKIERFEYLNVEVLGLKQLTDFKDYYIGPNGDFYSYKDGYKTTKGWRKLTPDIDSKGYHWIRMVKNGKYKRESVHRMVGFYFVDGYFDGAVINHIDANPYNNHYTNLEWITQKENIHKSYKTSGVGANRNQRQCWLKYPDGTMSEPFKSIAEMKRFVKANNLDCSAETLECRRPSRGFEIILGDKISG